MKQVFHTCLLLLTLLLSAFAFPNQNEPKDTRIRIETPYGTIVARLYNDTPLHRDNFISLIKDGYYDSLLFHRVIKDFMIQGGDPDSRQAQAGEILGNGGPDYTLPAEIRPGHYHKKGALAAARMGDDVNPEKASSGSQFYIVQGAVYEENVLDMLENRINDNRRREIGTRLLQDERFANIEAKITQARDKNDQKTLQQITLDIQTAIEQEMEKEGLFRFTEEQRRTYTTVGGAPHLDATYTVFGEVEEGLEIIEKIAAEAVDGYARPLKDIRMKITLSE